MFLFSLFYAYVYYCCCSTRIDTLNFLLFGIDLLAQRVSIFTSKAQFNLFNEFNNDDNADSAEASSIDLHSNILFLIENVLYYADITNDDQTVYIDSDANEADYDDLTEFYGNQYGNEIKYNRNVYETKWISYQQWQNRFTHGINTDDHTISSIERI